MFYILVGLFAVSDNENLIEEEEYYDCIGKQVVKGGLIATIKGIRAFIPASHLDVRYVNDITEYVGKQMKVKIIEIEKHRHRVVASRKQYILDEEKKAKDAEINDSKFGHLSWLNKLIDLNSEQNSDICLDAKITSLS